MTISFRHLLASFLLLTLIIPAGSAIAGDSNKSGYLLINTSHKSTPKNKGLDLKPAAATASSDLFVLNSSNAKRRPNQSAESSYWPLYNKLSARSAIIMDARTGEVLFAKQPDQPGQPASTIKVLTGLVAMQSLKNDDMVPVSKRAAQMPRSKIYLSQNKSYKANDMINAVLLASANDASVALAEKIAGSEKSFALLMSKKAKELGASNTVCKTASGLTSKGQYTTARDLAIIFNQAMKNQEFADRVRVVKTRTDDGTLLSNHNKALWRIAGNEGGKTGYTNAAKQTYVGKFSRNQQEILVAIMGSKTMWNDIGHLVEYGFSNKANTMAANTSEPPSVQTKLQVFTDNKKMAKL